MARRVDAGNHAHALAVRIGDDAVHLKLVQGVRGGVVADTRVIGIVAGIDGILDIIAGISRAVHGQGHVIQQEAETVIADCELDVIEARGSAVVDDLLDVGFGIVLSAAVKEQNIVLVIAVDRAGLRRNIGCVFGGLRCVCPRVPEVPQVLPAGRKDRGGQNAERQNHGEKDRKESDPFLFHDLYSLLFIHSKAPDAQFLRTELPSTTSPGFAAEFASDHARSNFAQSRTGSSSVHCSTSSIVARLYSCEFVASCTAA